MGRRRSSRGHSGVNAKATPSISRGDEEADGTCVAIDGVAVSCRVSPFRTDADEDHVGGPLGIELEQLCISVAGRELLEDSKLSLQPGSRYGLVGANGVGKSTLLRQLAVPGRLVPAHISSLIVEQEDAGDERDAVQTVVDADTELLELLERERMLQEADDSGDTTRAASAVAQATAKRLRVEADKLGRRVEKSAAARSGGYRAKWIEAEQAAKEAELAALVLRWVEAERAARHAEAKVANLQSTSTSTREGRKQRRRMPPLCFRAGAQLAPESAALKLRSRAEKIAKALDSRCAGRGDDLRAAAWAEEDGRAEAAERAAEEGESTSGRDNPNAKVWEDLAEALSEVRQEMTDKGKDKGEATARAAAILRGLGFSDEQAAKQPTSYLSGGWRMRVALARALFVSPSLLMLDEPTNHLDLPAILWLERWLTNVVDSEAIVIIVSHDRAFLDAVCTDILRLAGQKLESYLGMDYSTYAESAVELCAAAEREAAALAQRKKTMQKSIEEMINKARESRDDKRLKQAAARKKKLAALDALGGLSSAPAADPTIRLQLPSAEPLGFYGSVLQVEQASCAWKEDGPAVVADVTLEVDMASRMGILGRNGGGKSTLLATIAGSIKPLCGQVQRRHNLRIGYFSQHHVGSLLETTLPSTTPCSLMCNRFGIKDQEARAFLARFGLPGRLAVQPIGTLSGGQKVRLCLALMFWQPPHILLLDEVSNHLDAQTISALSTALDGFDGGLVLVSHDRQLLRDTCTEFYSVTKGGKLRHLDGGVDQYVQSVTKRLGRF